ncbi:hypothetical protein ACWCP6_27870 [Streptomyces sp. NPDC002004]
MTREMCRVMGRSFFWDWKAASVAPAMHRREALHLVALSRCAGRRMDSGVEAVAARFARAATARKRVRRVSRVGTTALAGCPLILLLALYLFGSPGTRPSLLYYACLLATVWYSAGSLGALLAWQTAQRFWTRLAGDHRAVRWCAFVLHDALLVAYGRDDAVRGVNAGVSEICRVLEEYAAQDAAFPAEGQRQAVSAHVMQVRRALVAAANGLLRDGRDALPGLVRTVSTLLDRLVAERWLALLDLEEPSAAADADDLASGPTEERRDRLVVLAGSMLAAGGLATAAAFGVPLGAAVPGALVFLLGPAMMWGGKGLRPSAHRMFASLQEGIGRAGATAEPPSAPATSDTAQPPG